MKKFYILVLAIASICLVSCKEKAEEPAKYVFLMIGDGMGNSQVAATEAYLSYKAGTLGGEHLSFTQYPVFGLCTTHSANHRVTDSSAAGTAISSGVKTKNGSVGIDAEGNDIESMAAQFHEIGYKVGITSSVPINHATPASFYAHDKRRGNYYKITSQIPESGYEFFSGAGFIDYFGKEGDQEGSADLLDKAGYKVCFGEEEYKQYKNDYEHVVLVPAVCKDDNADNYTIGHIKDDLRLENVMRAAIDFLGDEKPFFIMCEGGEIDWAGHANSTMPLIDAVIRFDEAIQVAYEFYLQHPDETLIVVTADHETGGIALGGPQNKYDVFWDKLEEAWDAEEGAYKEGLDNTEINRAGNIGWTTTSHTGGAVPVYAIGKGAERFAGMMDNTDLIHKIMLK